MSAQAHAVGVADAHAGGQHVVHHAGELVDPEDARRATGGDQGQAGLLEAGHGAGALGGPHDVGERAEQPVEVLGMGQDQAVGEQVQAQVGVRGVGRGGAEVDRAHHDLLGCSTHLVGAGGGGEPGMERRGFRGARGPAELGRGIPGVEGGAVGRDGREADAPCMGRGRVRGRRGHGRSLRSRAGRTPVLLTAQDEQHIPRVRRRGGQQRAAEEGGTGPGRIADQGPVPDQPSRGDEDPSADARWAVAAHRT